MGQPQFHIDHFVGYIIDNWRHDKALPKMFVKDQIIKKKLEEDEYEKFDITLDKMKYIAVAANKDDEKKSGKKLHLAWYSIIMKPREIEDQRKIQNQLTGFDDKDGHRIKFKGPVAILCPTKKKDEDSPYDLKELDHYLVYETSSPSVNKKDKVKLDDQFLQEQHDAKIKKLSYFCIPCDKTVEGKKPIQKKYEHEHLAVYEIEKKRFRKDDLKINNQFGDQKIDVKDQELLFVPTLKFYLKE